MIFQVPLVRSDGLRFEFVTHSLKPFARIVLKRDIGVAINPGELLDQLGALFQDLP